LIRTTTSFVAGAVVALVLGTGTAYAATGGKFILGRSNSASTTTTLSNSGGTALTLNSRAGQPSLRVNRNVKVPLLNSDLLDGLDQSAFARVTSLGTIAATGEVWDPANTPGDTTDDVVAAWATCPAGSQVVGGGAGDFTSDGLPLYSAPDGANTWMVVSNATVITDVNAASLEAYARCYNPRGNVTGNARMAPVPHKPSAKAVLAARKIAANR
jgi:hypothetical protein